MTTTEKITINLWFDEQAEEARAFYTSVFKNASVGRTAYYGKEGFEVHGRKAGSVMTAEFSLNGLSFVALNGGPHFKFNEAISLVINCDNQEEVDHYWNSLSEGGDEKAQMCGWLKDKYGLSWQVVPKLLPKLISDPDAAKAGRAMQAMLKIRGLLLVIAQLFQKLIGS